ncbi:sulfatase-like hydrolase/transferase [Sphingobium sp. 3R8]|uniref:sulfatase-like hydrolase/transferase n=1 Tax=Sphingobium sp. 3R8 TaxID=2874921 RepID=UPI001CC8F185|nr:sulfatase-like hydrolase/transferase [Sphingobium sp. 3R8]MBZ9649113.1 sulfatase-like hydrolase/transferase [Sphingobium sp. 3R8]
MQMLTSRRHVLTGLAGGVAAMAGGRTHAATARMAQPNFIVILTDDMGYGDIGPMGGKTIATPYLDKMARSGRVLTDYYAPANTCTPSRAGMLTGRYAIRTGLNRPLLARDTAVLPRSETSIAKALRPQYASAMIGKWHLGHSGPDWSPLNYGFDLFYGLPYSHDITPLSLCEDAGQGMRTVPFVHATLQQQFCDRAERFITDNRERPFFLNLSLSSPHLPNFPASSWAGKSHKAGAYGDSVMEIDAIVGRVLDCLSRNGIERQSLVLFTSDNGPWFEGSPGGLRGRKGGSGFDGAYRVPFVAHMPGTVGRGRRDAIAMGIDLMPTFLAMAGLSPPPGLAMDGKDIGAVLKAGAPTPHDHLILFNQDDVIGIRTQRWKYVAADYYAGTLALTDMRGYPGLYDMLAGPEDYSVASVHPAVARGMRELFLAERERFRPLRTNPTDPLADQERHHPAWVLPQPWRDWPQ